MWTYEDMQDEFSSMAQTDNSNHLTHGYKNINLAIKKLETALGMPPMQEERTYATLTSTNSYPLPERFIDMDQFYSIVSSFRYYADKEYSEEAWGRLMRNTSSQTSDQLTNIFIRPGLHKFEIYPTAATADNTMTMIYTAFSKDLSASDYIDGTITTLANGDTSVTFSGTTLTDLMADRWLKTDDGEWYKISSIDSTTTATLLMPYQGTSISAGSSSFTIGEIPRIPEGTHDLPVNFALWKYFLGDKRDKQQAVVYERLWFDGVKDAKANFRNRYSSAVIQSQRGKLNRPIQDPNDYPDLSSLA